MVHFTKYSTSALNDVFTQEGDIMYKVIIVWIVYVVEQQEINFILGFDTEEEAQAYTDFCRRSRAFENQVNYQKVEIRQRIGEKKRQFTLDAF